MHGAAAALLMAVSATPVAAQEDPGIADNEALVVEKGDEGRYWSRDVSASDGLAPRYPRNAVLARATGCVNIGFIIQPDGTTTGYRVLIGKSSIFGGRQQSAVISQFAKATVDMIKQWRFQPGPGNPDRLRGFASTFADFSIGTGSGLGSECVIDDLGAFMRAAADRPPAG